MNVLVHIVGKFDCHWIVICRHIMNSIVILYVSCMDIKITILSLKNSSPGYDESLASIAKQCIDNYVVPLTYIINMSLMEGVFPSEFKLAKVVPFFKDGESNKVTNYTPISVLSFFSKVFEKQCIIMLLILWINMKQFINISFGSENNTPLNTLL